MNLFQKTLAGKNETGCPPIWYMRQAGRYHNHYQKLKETYSFIDLCRTPELSAEAAMGPIEDFDYDAAILFSDILFPLEALGMSLDFAPGPKIEPLLGQDTLKSLTPVQDRFDFFGFQYEALEALHKRLPDQKGLIGFVGGPYTLYLFAADGSAKGETPQAIAGMEDGRFDAFMEAIIPIIVDNMRVQAQSKIDCMAILDSCSYCMSPKFYRTRYMPFLRRVIEDFRSHHPDLPILYYAQQMHESYIDDLNELNIQALGIAHDRNMKQTLRQYGHNYIMQGNFSPEIMTQPWDQLEPKLIAFIDEIKELPKELRKRWIFSLGHGVTPTVPEENVRSSIKLVREYFR